MQLHQLFLFLLLLVPLVLLFVRHERTAEPLEVPQEEPQEPPERAYLIAQRRDYLQLGKLIDAELEACDDKRKPVLLRQKIGIDKKVFDIDRKLGYM